MPRIYLAAKYIWGILNYQRYTLKDGREDETICEEQI